MAGLLMTRPDLAARKFVAELPDWVPGGPVVYSPLLDIHESDVEVDLTGIKGVIFTSANGVRWARRLTSGGPAYCVGAATTRAAQAAGWQATQCGETAESLIQSLINDPVPGPLLHIRGQHARGDVAASLSRGGLPCTDVGVYEQHLLPLSDEGCSLLLAQRDVIVPLFSPRSARQFADTCPTACTPHLIALSLAVEKEINHMNFKSLITCNTPDADTMRAHIINLCKSLHRVEGGGAAQ